MENSILFFIFYLRPSLRRDVVIYLKRVCILTQQICRLDYCLVKFPSSKPLCSVVSLTWQAGRMMQGIWPRNQRPVKLVMGVRGAAVRHITMSDTAMLHTNRFIPVCSAGVLDTEKKKVLKSFASVNILISSSYKNRNTNVLKVETPSQKVKVHMVLLDLI